MPAIKALPYLSALVNKTSGISIDSRIVKANETFFAPPSSKYNVLPFIEEVIGRNAALIITDHPQFKVHDNIIYVPDAYEAVAYCADKFYINLPKHIIGITGTNGKTSTVDYIRQLLVLLGQRASSIGTIGIVSNTDISEEISKLSSLTSNDLIANYKILGHLKSQGVDYSAIEVSSIGMTQNRFGHLSFDHAAFTSFSQEHLDYHHNMESYFKAKMGLFEKHLKKNGQVFVFEQVLQAAAQLGIKPSFNNSIIIGDGDNCDVRVKIIKSNINGQRVNFEYAGRKYEFSTDIIVRLQSYNMVLAALIVHKYGFELKDIVSKLSNLKSVAGRMQKAFDPIGLRHIFIDYAHDPSSLENALLELVSLQHDKSSKLFCVFGCGGQRDKFKRPIMGQIASKLADFVIVTDDNPRNEDPKSIRLEITSGIDNKNYREISDRYEAIKSALGMMKSGDILLIAGKGHEQFQTYGNDKRPFSDLKIANQILLGK